MKITSKIVGRWEEISRLQAEIYKQHHLKQQEAINQTNNLINRINLIERINQSINSVFAEICDKKKKRLAWKNPFLLLQ